MKFVSKLDLKDPSHDGWLKLVLLAVRLSTTMFDCNLFRQGITRALLQGTLNAI